MQNGTKFKPKCTYICIYLRTYKHLSTNNYAERCNQVHMYMFSRVICIQMHVYIVVYGHIYPYMHCFGAQEVNRTNAQRNHTQEGSVCCTQLIQLQCSATQLPGRGLQHQHSYPDTWTNKYTKFYASNQASLNLVVCIDSVSVRNVLLPSRYFHRPQGKVLGR